MAFVVEKTRYKIIPAMNLDCKEQDASSNGLWKGGGQVYCPAVLSTMGSEGICLQFRTWCRDVKVLATEKASTVDSPSAVRKTYMAICMTG